MLCSSPAGVINQPEMTEYSAIDRRGGNTGLARIFHSRAGSRGRKRRSAGFPACLRGRRSAVADFQTGGASNRRGVRRFRNLRYSILGKLRYRIACEISGLEAEARPAVPVNSQVGKPALHRNAVARATHSDCGSRVEAGQGKKL